MLDRNGGNSTGKRFYPWSGLALAMSLWLLQSGLSPGSTPEPGCPLGLRVYVANSDSDTVSVLNPAHPLVTTISVGNSPLGVAANPLIPRVYVANSDSNLLSVIDTNTMARSDVHVGKFPRGVAVSPDGNSVYVTNFDDNTVSVVDTTTAPNTVKKVIKVGRAPSGVAVAQTQIGPRAYVTNSFQNTVSVIDVKTNTALESRGKPIQIPVGRYPQGVAVGAQEDARVYVANLKDGTVSVIDTGANKVVATVKVGRAPNGVAVSPDGQWVYVSSQFYNTVSAINADGDEVKARVEAGGSSYGLTVSSDGRIYASDLGGDTIWVIEPVIKEKSITLSVAGTIKVGKAPTGVATGRDGRIYVANRGDGTVSVIDFTQHHPEVMAEVRVGRRPEGVAVGSGPDGTPPGVYVANSAADTVSVFDTATNRALATVAVGKRPEGVAVGKSPDGTSFRVYVTNSNVVLAENDRAIVLRSGTVSVIDGARNRVIATVAVGRRPEGVAVSPDGRWIYVVNVMDQTLSCVNAMTLQVATVPLGKPPNGVAVSPGGDLVYLTTGSFLSLVDTKTNLVAKGPSVGLMTQGIAANPTGHAERIHVVHDNALFVLERSPAGFKPIADVPVGMSPIGVSVDPQDGRWVYVTNSGEDTVSIVDTAEKRADTVRVGKHPTGIAVKP